MAIIYSYPLAEEVTNDSWVLGSEMDNGLRVVKNYSVGDIVSFTRGFVTLNDVLDNDNESLLDAKIGDLYLYDDFNEGYGKIRLSNDAFRFTKFTGAPTFYVDSYSLSVGGKMIIDGQNLTQPRQFTMPNKSGVVALIEDIALTLQEVLGNDHNLVDGNFFAGTDAGSSNSGNNINAFGTDAGSSNSGNNINAFGTNAGLINQGSNVNSLGSFSGFLNEGNNVNAFGYSSGSPVGYFEPNIFNNVNLFGEFATADENGQTVLSKDGYIMARISTTDLTATRKYNLPDESGTVALTLDLPQVAANFANDAAAAIGGIAVGGLYHTAGTVKIRLV